MPGQAVMGAAESGTSFPLKKRDQLLDYILTLMGHDDEDVFPIPVVSFCALRYLSWYSF